MDTDWLEGVVFNRRKHGHFKGNRYWSHTHVQNAIATSMYETRVSSTAWGWQYYWARSKSSPVLVPRTKDAITDRTRPAAYLSQRGPCWTPGAFQNRSRDCTHWSRDCTSKPRGIVLFSESTWPYELEIWSGTIRTILSNRPILTMKCFQAACPDNRAPTGLKPRDEVTHVLETDFLQKTWEMFTKMQWEL